MMNANGVERLHRRRAAFLAEVTGVIVGEAEHVEAGGAIVFCVARRRTEQVAGARIAAFLAGLTTVCQHAFEIAERNVGR